MGSDSPISSDKIANLHFNPRSPHGERQLVHQNNDALFGISIHAPRMGSDPVQIFLVEIRKRISIHAPRMGSDQSRFSSWKFVKGFQSTLPAWGATRGTVRNNLLCGYFNPRSPHGERRSWCYFILCNEPFQSTLPAWGATWISNQHGCWLVISIHAPRMGSDSCLSRIFRATRISIHAPRMGSDRHSIFGN